MPDAFSDWAEERDLRADARRGSKLLLRALLRVHAPPLARRGRGAPRKDSTVAFNPLIQVVADHYRIEPRHMLSASRKPIYAGPRHVAMFIAYRASPNASLPTVGRMFSRDHTTVLHAIRKTEERRAYDADFRAEVDALCNNIVVKSPTVSGDTEKRGA